MIERLYISGAITGTTDYKERFERIERMLEKVFDGNIINPVKICSDIPLAEPWESFMKRCISHLVFCDKIYMMNGWEKSRGSREELRIAQMLKLKVGFELAEAKE
jgi:hypothetical protein